MRAAGLFVHTQVIIPDFIYQILLQETAMDKDCQQETRAISHYMHLIMFCPLKKHLETATCTEHDTPEDLVHRPSRYP